MKNMWKAKAISSNNGLFHLRTERTSYLLRVTPHGHLEQVWWGAAVREEDAQALCLKRTAVYGSSVLYKVEDAGYPGAGMVRLRPGGLPLPAHRAEHGRGRHHGFPLCVP